MKCKRCQGLMAEDQLFDFEGSQGFIWMKGWGCMNCGYAADPLIEANRHLHEAHVGADGGVWGTRIYKTESDLEETNRSFVRWRPF